MRSLSVLPILAFTILLGSCSSTQITPVSLNQLPPQVRNVIEREAGDGRIDEIEMHERKGMRTYDVHYRQNNQDFELWLDDEGKIMEKVRE